MRFLKKNKTYFIPEFERSVKPYEWDIDTVKSLISINKKYETIFLDKFSKTYELESIKESKKELKEEKKSNK